MSAILEVFKLDEGQTLYGPVLFIFFILLIGVVALICGIGLGFGSKARAKYASGLKSRFSKLGLDELAARAREDIKKLPNSAKRDIADVIDSVQGSRSSTEIVEYTNQLAARNEAKIGASLLAFGTGAVLILGLAGTFVAFFEIVAKSGIGSDTLASLAPSGSGGGSSGKAESAPSSLEESIPFIVKHLNLAFVASIVGVVSSVLLQGISSLWTRREGMLCMLAIEQLLLNAFHHGGGADAEEREEAAESEASSAALKGIEKALAKTVSSLAAVEKRLAAVAESTPEAIGRTLTAIEKELKDAPKRYERLIDAAEQSKGAIESISAKASESLGDAIKEFDRRQIQALQTSEQYKNELLKEIAVGDEVRRKAFQEQVGKIVIGFEDIAKSWETASQDLATAIEKDRAVLVEDMRKAGKASTQAIVDTSKAALEQLRKGYEAQVSEWSTIADLAKSQHDQTEKLVDVFGCIGTDAATMLSDILKQSGATLEAARETASEAIAGHGEIVKGVSIVEHNVRAVGDLVATAKTSFEGAADQAKGNLDALGLQLNTLSGQVGRLIKAAEKLRLTRTTGWWLSTKRGMTKLFRGKGNG